MSVLKTYQSGTWVEAHGLGWAGSNWYPFFKWDGADWQPTTVTPALSYRDLIMADNPLGYWRMGESSGTAAADEVGAHPAVFTGGTLGQAGIPGAGGNTSVALNGSTDYVTSSGWSSWPTDFSIEIWIWWTANVGWSAIANNQSAATGTSADGFWLGDSGGTILQWSINPNGTQQVARTLTQNEWHHLAGTKSGLTSTLYYDGAQIGQWTIPSYNLSSNTILRFGRQSATGTNALAARVDEAAFYGHALTGQQVQAHYIAGSTAS